MRLIVKCGFGPFIFDGSDSTIRWGRNELDSGWMHGRRRWIRCWFHANSLSFRSNHWSSPPELSRNCCIFRWQNHPDANGLADATESIPISSNSAEFTHSLKLDANQWNFWLFRYQFCVYSAWADVRMGRIRLKPDKTLMKSPIESSETWRNCTGKFSQSNWQLTHPSVRLDVRMQRIKNQSNRTKLASRHRSKPLNGKSVIKSNKQTKKKQTDACGCETCGWRHGRAATNWRWNGGGWVKRHKPRPPFPEPLSWLCRCLLALYFSLLC